MPRSEFAMIAQMENLETIVEIPCKKPRKPYTRKAIPEIPKQIAAPLPPNPNILAMESKIGELVEQRSSAQFAISRANQQFQAAQSVLQSAKDEFTRLEQEIQYRMGLISQMRGGPGPAMTLQGVGPSPVFIYEHPGAGYQNAPPLSPPYQPAQPYPQYPPQFDPRMVPAQGVGSAPAPNYGLYEDVTAGPDGARTGSAEDLRRDELRTRGY